MYKSPTKAKSQKSKLRRYSSSSSVSSEDRNYLDSNSSDVKTTAIDRMLKRFQNRKLPSKLYNRKKTSTFSKVHKHRSKAYISNSSSGYESEDDMHSPMSSPTSRFTTKRSGDIDDIIADEIMKYRSGIPSNSALPRKVEQDHGFDDDIPWQIPWDKNFEDLLLKKHVAYSSSSEEDNRQKEDVIKQIGTYEKVIPAVSENPVENLRVAKDMISNELSSLMNNLTKSDSSSGNKKMDVPFCEDKIPENLPPSAAVIAENLESALSQIGGQFVNNEKPRDEEEAKEDEKKGADDSDPKLLLDTFGATTTDDIDMILDRLEDAQRDRLLSSYLREDGSYLPPAARNYDQDEATAASNPATKELTQRVSDIRQFVSSEIDRIEGILEGATKTRVDLSAKDYQPLSDELPGYSKSVEEAIPRTTEFVRVSGEICQSLNLAILALKHNLDIDKKEEKDKKMRQEKQEAENKKAQEKRDRRQKAAEKRFKEEESAKMRVMGESEIPEMDSDVAFNTISSGSEPFIPPEYPELLRTHSTPPSYDHQAAMDRFDFLMENISTSPPPNSANYSSDSWPYLQDTFSQDDYRPLEHSRRREHKARTPMVFAPTAPPQSDPYYVPNPESFQKRRLGEKPRSLELPANISITTSPGLAMLQTMDSYRALRHQMNTRFRDTTVV